MGTTSAIFFFMQVAKKNPYQVQIEQKIKVEIWKGYPYILVFLEIRSVR